tara:strand:+ start:404 stop:1594 length:1191 start_codon:yes stop_codon:yes gene_type:complete
MAKKCEDITIIGGGLIGLFLAPILAKLNFKVALVDKEKIVQKTNIENDSRTTAISLGTKLFLEKYGIWKKISRYAEPINQIEVLNRESNSNIFFNNNISKSPMGFIVENKTIKKILIEKIKSTKNINIFDSTEINNIIPNSNSILVNSVNNVIESKLVIAADGKNSFIKSLYKFPSYNIKYNQAALVTNIQHSKNHKNTAFEIFLPNGPLAMLPMKSFKKNIYKSSLIWTENISTINKMKKMELDSVKDLIEENIYKYLGKVLKIDSFKVFPLSAHVCRKFYNKRIVLVGDSAHSIHPIAGQGWNLGMRDVKYLVETLYESKKFGLDIGSLEILKKYNNNRFADVSSMLFITHSLNKVFLSKSNFINNLRSIGFNYINKRKKITSSLVNYAMGVNL